MTNSQSVEQDGIVAGNIFAMLNNANRGVNRMKFISHCERHTLLHMAPKWFDHWTTWSGDRSYVTT